MLTQPAYLVYGVARPGQASALQGLRGLDGQGLSVIRCGALAAVVSSHQTDMFEEADTPALHAFAASYHRCVTQMSAHMDLLPMQLGMMLADAQAVRQYLQASSGPLETHLSQLAGFQEWQLQLTLCDDSDAAPKVADAKMYLRARKAALDQKKAAQQSCDVYLEALAQHLLKDGARACRRAPEGPNTLYVLWPRGADQALLTLVEAQAAQMDALRLDVHGPEAPFWFVREESQSDAA
ncbi:MAG: GvpL/GvpF family gas vesicle protein [Pseudomonadota bacterium]